MLINLYISMYVLVRWMINLLLDIFLCNERYIRTHKFKAQIRLALRARHNLFTLNLLVHFIVYCTQNSSPNIYLFQSLNYRNYSIKRRGAYSFLTCLGAALIRGRRLFKCGACSNNYSTFPITLQGLINGDSK